MIRVYFYNNGAEVLGHSYPKPCFEVSILTWNIANTLCRWDKKANSQTDVNGHSWFTFDKENEQSVFLYEEYKNNIQAWIEVLYPNTEVDFSFIDDDFTPKVGD